MTLQKGSTLNLTLGGEQLSAFFPLLQEGVTVPARVGSTLADFLGEQLLLDTDYISSRISTIFMNNRPVDDIKTVLLHEGSVVALSGAMPGLVGATMRSGGYYAALRGGITYTDSDIDTAIRDGIIKLKVYNLLLPELTAPVLKRGVVFCPDDLLAFFRGQDQEFWNGCTDVLLNQSEIDPAELRSDELFNRLSTVTIQVKFR